MSFCAVIVSMMDLISILRPRLPALTRKNAQEKTKSSSQASLAQSFKPWKWPITRVVSLPILDAEIIEEGDPYPFKSYKETLLRGLYSFQYIDAYF